MGCRFSVSDAGRPANAGKGDAPDLWEVPPADGSNSGNSDDLDPNPFLDRADEPGRAPQPLPWESKAGYVMGSGELGLLNELQLPRRGASVALDPDFLRIPASREADGPPGAEAPGVLDGGLDAALAGSAEATPAFGARGHAGIPDPDGNTPGWKPPDLSLIRSTSVDPVLKSKAISVDEVRRKGCDGLPDESGVGVGAPRYGGEADQEGEFDMSGLRGVVAAGRRVETASSADRIARFPPGTRFRVAVDKGVTGLGITVKEIHGRFFVYRLQTLPDGSPGAAEVGGPQGGRLLVSSPSFASTDGAGPRNVPWVLDAFFRSISGGRCDGPKVALVRLAAGTRSHLRFSLGGRGEGARLDHIPP